MRNCQLHVHVYFIAPVVRPYVNQPIYRIKKKNCSYYSLVQLIIFYYSSNYSTINTLTFYGENYGTNYRKLWNFCLRWEKNMVLHQQLWIFDLHVI